jgi:hypothetical protein
MFEEPNAVQIRVVLDEIEPQAWRRLVLPIRWNLEQLHLTIQAAFNWWNYHLHEFRIGGLRYGDLQSFEEEAWEGAPRTFDEREVCLRDFGGMGTSFIYVYDFGDDWNHTVEIEKLLALESAPRHGSCIDGAHARPPEDVGGPPGYQQFLAIIADPTHPEHDETRRWCGGHFDPHWFDLDRVDKDVRNALRTNGRRRLHQPKPKQPTPSS